MDPKKSASLDPKSKEIYDRVMGTNVPSGQAAVQVAPPPPPPSPTGLSSQPMNAKPSVSASPQRPIIPTNPTVHFQSQSFVTEKKEEKKSGSLMPLLIFLGAVIFFAAYAIFWVRFFNISLPFLPK